MPSNFTRNQIRMAIDMAWRNKAVLLVYPADMDLIVVDMPCEEHAYLSDKTYIIDTNQFPTKQEFHNFVNNIMT